jgi:hypothetical protein
LTLPELLEWHWRRYPLLAAADVYKLLHQGVFGPAHIIRSTEHAREWLLEEAAGMDVSRLADTADFEPVDTAERFIRVNLVPLAGTDGALERLVQVLVESSRVTGDAPEMARRLAGACDWFDGAMPGIGRDLAALSITTEAAGFPAVHHSKLYEQAYRPAYRVVLRSLWPV